MERCVMPESPETSPEQDRAFHSYSTHHIPWYIRGMWIVFGIALIWYLIRFAVPMAKNYF